MQWYVSLRWLICTCFLHIFLILSLQCSRCSCPTCIAFDLIFKLLRWMLKVQLCTFVRFKVHLIDWALSLKQNSGWYIWQDNFATWQDNLAQTLLGFTSVMTWLPPRWWLAQALLGLISVMTWLKLLWASLSDTITLELCDKIAWLKLFWASLQWWLGSSSCGF